VTSPPAIYISYILRELISPINYLIALLIGVLINLLQGGSPMFSAVPYLVPVAVQALSKGTVKFRSREMHLLVQLPKERIDPAFVMGPDGEVLACSGNTELLFEKHGIRRLSDLVCRDQFVQMMLEVEDSGEVSIRECYAPLVEKWYSVVIKKPGPRQEYLVWFDDISERKNLDLRLQSLRSYSNEILNSVDEIAGVRTGFVHLARLILGNGFQAVFITEEDDGGTHRGSVFRLVDGEPSASPVIGIDAGDAAPILLSRRTSRLFSAHQEEFGGQDGFDRTFDFDDQVRNFIGAPVFNFINYHEGRISLIAFNRDGGIAEGDRVFIETAVNTARTVRSLTDLVIDNDQKFVQGIMGLCAASEFSDEITGQHIFRVNLYAALLAEKLGMEPQGIRTIRQVAAIHDIGKVAIPHIIKLPRKLSDQERAVMQMHPAYGARILEQMMSYEDHVDPRLKMAYQIALHHHQTWIGSGYPNVMSPEGELQVITDPTDPEYLRNRPLKGREIPRVSLIVAISDTYDALRAQRQYKEGFSHAKTMEILARDDFTGLSGEERFGPEIYQLFLDIHRDFETIYEDHQDDGAAAS
jgi:HD-GYP domain-containing protein (c-di-GMP phosphodiesterase class II)